MGVLVGYSLLFQLAKGLVSFLMGEAAVPFWGSLGAAVFAALLTAPTYVAFGETLERGFKRGGWRRAT